MCVCVASLLAWMVGWLFGCSVVGVFEKHETKQSKTNQLDSPAIQDINIDIDIRYRYA